MRGILGVDGGSGKRKELRLTRMHVIACNHDSDSDRDDQVTIPRGAIP